MSQFWWYNTNGSQEAIAAVLALQDKKIAIELKRRLEGQLPLLDLRVFGSRARDEATPDSDLDVFIKVKTCTPELRRLINEIAWEVGFEMERVISTVVATPEQLSQGPLGASPLILAIEREGVLV